MILYILIAVVLIFIFFIGVIFLYADKKEFSQKPIIAQPESPYGWWKSATEPDFNFYIKKNSDTSIIIEGANKITNADIRNNIIQAFGVGGTLSGNKIIWTNGNVWTKYSNNVIDWAGDYTSKTEPGQIFSLSNLTNGKVLLTDPTSKTKTPTEVIADLIYAYGITGQLRNNKEIHWSNGNVWTKK